MMTMDNSEFIQTYKRICLLLPTYRMVPVPAYQSMISFISNLYKHGHEVAEVMVDQCNVVAARNKLATAAYEIEKEEGADLYVWIDSDHTFRYENFMELVYHFHMCGDEAKILSARNFTKDLSNPQVCAYTKKGTAYEPIPANLENIQEVDAVGFGFIIIAPEVITKMYETHGSRQFMVKFTEHESTDVVSEDLYWCDLVRNLGYKILVDNLVTPGHYGGIIDGKFVRKFRDLGGN